MRQGTFRTGLCTTSRQTYHAVDSQEWQEKIQQRKAVTKYLGQNADKLEGLLIKLDYEMKDGFYQHNNRNAVFVGDFIDRGTQNRRVVEVVRGMVENGHA